MATVEEKLIKQTKWPENFRQKVDLSKVNVEVMKKWMAERITEIMGTEDDIVLEMAFNLFEESNSLDIKKMQVQLTGFLEGAAPRFCKELWDLCISAQSNSLGVPQSLLDAKKAEIEQSKIAGARAQEAARERREEENRRDRNIEEIRYRERSERDRGRGGGRGRGRAQHRLDSHSPSRQYRSRSRSHSPARGGRQFDTYVPRSRGDRRRYESPGRRRNRTSRTQRASSSLSRSRTPPRRRRHRSPTSSRSRSPRRSRSPSSRRSESPRRSKSPKRSRPSKHSERRQD